MHMVNQYFKITKMYFKPRPTSHKKTPQKGNKVWIRRSSGKWQRAVISAVILDDDGLDAKCNIYFNAGNNNIGSKKNLDIDDILFY